MYEVLERVLSNWAKARRLDERQGVRPLVHFGIGYRFEKIDDDHTKVSLRVEGYSLAYEVVRVWPRERAVALYNRLKRDSRYRLLDYGRLVMRWQRYGSLRSAVELDTRLWRSAYRNGAKAASVEPFSI